MKIKNKILLSILYTILVLGSFSLIWIFGSLEFQEKIIGIITISFLYGIGIIGITGGSNE